MTSAGVYEITTVEIPEDEVLRMGLRGNNRGRVIYLSFIVEKCLGKNAKQVTCFVDADFSHVLGDILEKPCLIYTDFACMEAYLFENTIIEKLISVYYGRSDWPIGTILITIANTLSELFLLRMANHTLGWYMDWLDKPVCMKLEGWTISFDLDDYVGRFLSKNRRHSQKNEFIQEVDQLRKRLKADHRFHIHGHDLVALLVWYFRERGLGIDSHTRENLHRELALCVDYKLLLNHHAFASLLDRATH
jgi:hypothetical protein